MPEQRNTAVAVYEVRTMGKNIRIEFEEIQHEINDPSSRCYNVFVNGRGVVCSTDESTARHYYKQLVTAIFD